MKSRNARRLAWVLLLSLLALSGSLLYLTERSYGAFREALQQIRFEVRLAKYQQAPLGVRLHMTATVTMPSVGMTAWLELIDWYLKSADGRVHLGFYTTGETELELVPGGTIEVPLEALVAGPNLEKLQQLREAGGSVSLLFQGTSRIMFRLPQGELRKKVPVMGLMDLTREGE